MILGFVQAAYKVRLKNRLAYLEKVFKVAQNIFSLSKAICDKTLWIFLFKMYNILFLTYIIPLQYFEINKC